MFFGFKDSFVWKRILFQKTYQGLLTVLGFYLEIHKKKLENSHSSYLFQDTNAYLNLHMAGWMCQKGTTLDNDFYVVVGKQCRTENAYAGHQHNIFI